MGDPFRSKMLCDIGERAGNKKGRQKPAFFIGLWRWSGRGDSGNRAGIHTCAAIDASFGVDNPLLSCFANGVGRAGIITCAAIDAFVSNYVRQNITSFNKFFIRLLIICIYFVKAIICFLKNPAQKESCYCAIAPRVSRKSCYNSRKL